MSNYDYNTLTMSDTLTGCSYDNTVVDETLHKEMSNAESEKQVLELSIERLYQSLKDSIKL